MFATRRSRLHARRSVITSHRLKTTTVSNKAELARVSPGRWRSLRLRSAVASIRVCAECPTRRVRL